MPSVVSFSRHELPTNDHKGLRWLADRLNSVGYSGALFYRDPTARDAIMLTVDQDNVSKKQLLHDMAPRDSLTVNKQDLVIKPGDTEKVRISGPPGADVTVHFSGIGFISETQFKLNRNGSYTFEFGPCPKGMAIVEPQIYYFTVPGTSTSPVAVSAVFM